MDSPDAGDVFSLRTKSQRREMISDVLLQNEQIKWKRHEDDTEQRHDVIISVRYRHVQTVLSVTGSLAALTADWSSIIIQRESMTSMNQSDTNSHLNCPRLS